MNLFKKRCEYCKVKIDKGKEVTEVVDIPELVGPRSKPFCCKEHAQKFKCEIVATPRTSFCPSCPV